jgi:excisionase family DNA binding protein
MEKHLKTIAEVAVLLSVSTKTVRKHIKAGTLKAYNFNSIYRISDEQLTNFLNTLQTNG